MKNLLTIVITMLMGFACIAHTEIANDLEIFAENGEKFTLFVNGQQINEKPASYVKIKNTHHNLVHVRIVMEDKRSRVIKRDALMIHLPGAGSETAPVAAVFMIKKRLAMFKKRRYKIRATTRSPKKIQNVHGFELHS